MTNLDSIYLEVMEACRAHDARKELIKDRENPALKPSTKVFHDRNRITVEPPDLIFDGDQNIVSSFIKKINKLGQISTKPAPPWLLTKNDMTVMKKYKDEQFVIQARALVNDGWLEFIDSKGSQNKNSKQKFQSSKNKNSKQKMKLPKNKNLTPKERNG